MRSIAISKEVPDASLKARIAHDDMTVPEGLLKHHTKALIESAMDAELTEQNGYQKIDYAEKRHRTVGTARRRRPCAPAR